MNCWHLRKGKRPVSVSSPKLDDILLSDYFLNTILGQPESLVKLVKFYPGLSPRKNKHFDVFKFQKNAWNKGQNQTNQSKNPWTFQPQTLCPWGTSALFLLFLPLLDFKTNLNPAPGFIPFTISLGYCKFLSVPPPLFKPNSYCILYVQK